LNLTLFDLDNTLLSGDSDFEWAQFLIEQGVRAVNLAGGILAWADAGHEVVTGDQPS